LKRMCVLRVGIDVRGLTFLRLFTESEDQDFRFSLAVAMEEPTELTDDEIAETQSLIDQLISCSLIQNNYDEKLCEDFYGLHRLVVEFLQTEFQSELPDLLQRVYSFYCTGKTIENPKTLEDLRPLLEAQHFAFQIGNYSEAEDLIYKLEDYLEPWGHWTLLQTLYQQILDRIPESSQPYILQRLGSRERDWGNWDQAETYYQTGLKLAEKNQDKSIIAGLTGQLGSIERNRGNWDEAERLYRQCLEIEEELGDRSGMASSWGVLGDIERKRGNWDEAERLYRQKLEMCEQLGDREGMSQVIGTMGDIESNRGNWDEAERLYRRSMAISQELGNPWLLAHNNYDLAQLYRAKNNPDRAQQHYAIAHQLFTQLGAAKDLEKIEQEWNAMS
jgi:tetratricopeptide (TPR) repeat protein